MGRRISVNLCELKLYMNRNVEARSSRAECANSRALRAKAAAGAVGTCFGRELTLPDSGRQVEASWSGVGAWASKGQGLQG